MQSTAATAAVQPGPDEREDDVQRSVTRAATALGFHVYDLSQGYRPGGRRHGTTRQTRGLPDRIMVHRSRALILFVEVKGTHTPITDEQLQFRDRVRAAGGIALIVRSLEAFLEALRELGFRLQLEGRIPSSGSGSSARMPVAGGDPR